MQSANPANANSEAVSGDILGSPGSTVFRQARSSTQPNSTAAPASETKTAMMRGWAGPLRD
jgi:hypothetical protein